VPPSASFLADHVSKPKRLKRFRDKSFVHLQKLDNDYAKTNVCLRHTNTQDLGQIMGLLRNERMRIWLQTSTSSLIWVNTTRRAGPSDWATAFATRIIEHAAKLDNMTVLYHLCGNHSTSSQVSTPTVLLQSLIMQLLEKHHKHFVRKVFPFTLEHFYDVQDDIHDLWDLFMKCCAEARVSCVWLILDHFDNLKKGEDYDFVLQALLHVVQDEHRVFKVFVSARTAGTPEEISEAATMDPSSSQVVTITVPKAGSSTAAAMLSKQKRPARLPDEPCPEQPASAPSPADIDDLLHSSSEDDLLSEDDTDQPRHLAESPTLLSSPQNKRLQNDDSDLDASDTSMEFMRDDPFATSDDDSDADIPRPLHNPAISSNGGGDDGDEDDDEEEEFSFAKRNTRKPSKHNVANSDISETSEPDDVPLVMSKSKSTRGQRHGSAVRTAQTKSPFDTSDSE